MKQRSPTLEGFRAMVLRPSLGLAEIAWRWSFGSAAALLLMLSFLQYLNTLPVSSSDMFLLRTRQPGLISQAIAHILRGSGPRVVDAIIVLGLTLASAWIAVAAVGRAVTLRAVGRGSAKTFEAEEGRWGFGSLAGLNFLRVTAALAAAVGCVAAWLIAAAASASDASPAVAVLVFLAIVMLVWLAWSGTNWLLSFATVFVVSAGEGTFGAIASSMRLLRARAGTVLAASTWFSLAHLAAFAIATFMVAFPLAFVEVFPAGVVLGGVLLVTLLYFAVADFLYIGRLAAYVAIIEAPDTLPVVPFAPGAGGEPRPALSFPPETRVDPDELILSDLPFLGQS